MFINKSLISFSIIFSLMLMTLSVRRTLRWVTRDPESLQHEQCQVPERGLQKSVRNPARALGERLAKKRAALEDGPISTEISVVCLKVAKHAPCFKYRFKRMIRMRS